MAKARCKAAGDATGGICHVRQLMHLLLESLMRSAGISHPPGNSN